MALGQLLRLVPPADGNCIGWPPRDRTLYPVVPPISNLPCKNSMGEHKALAAQQMIVERHGGK